MGISIFTTTMHVGVSARQAAILENAVLSMKGKANRLGEVFPFYRTYLRNYCLKHWCASKKTIARELSWPGTLHHPWQKSIANGSRHRTSWSNPVREIQ